MTAYSGDQPLFSSSTLHSMYDFFCCVRVFQAVVFTALAIGRALSSAPDTAKARVSASRIHALLQLMPTYLETGRNMVSVLQISN